MAKHAKRVGRRDAKALPAAKAPPGKQVAKTVRFDYIKSNFFRVLRVDGVHGGLTPRIDGIQMALFSERRPIPKSEEFPIDKKGKIGKRVSVIERQAIIREVEVEALLSVEGAKQLEQWLHEKLDQIETLRARISQNG